MINSYIWFKNHKTVWGINDRLEQFCDETGMSKTTAVEKILNRYFDEYFSKPEQDRIIIWRYCIRMCMQEFVTKTAFACTKTNTKIIILIIAVIVAIIKNISLHFIYWSFFEAILPTWFTYGREGQIKVGLFFYVQTRVKAFVFFYYIKPFL